MSNKRYHCPFCPAMGLHNEDYALSVNWQKGVFICFRCGTKGRVSALPPHFRKPLILKKKEGGKEETTDKTLEGMIPLREVWRGQEYLRKRGLDPKSLLDWVFVTRDRKRLIFPVFEGSNIIYYITRKMWGRGPRYKNKKGEIHVFTPYNLPQPPYDKLVVTEGVFDALSVHQWTGLPSLGLLGKNPNHKKLWQILNKTREDSQIIILLDSDAIQMSLYYYHELQGAGRTRTSLCILREGDPNDLGEEKLWKILKRWVS